MAIPLHAGLREVIAGYDALILDLWGVVHDGLTPYDGAIDCLARLAGAGKRVVILSNAPRRAHHAAARLDDMAIGADLYSVIVTSGEATRQALARRAEPWCRALGRRVFHLGKKADADLLDGLDYRPATRLEDADFLLATGPREDPAGDDAILRAAAAQALPMVCANPDLAVIRGGRREPCAGAYAARYESLGGVVHRLGKPHAGVYEPCLEALDGIERDRILAVGDSLATDIIGAQGVGLSSLLVTGGLLADAWGIGRATPPDAMRLEAACRDAGATPTAAIPAFVW